MKSTVVFRIITCCLVLALYSCHDEKKKPKAESVQNEINISSVNLVNLNGEKIHAGQLAGKTVFINFWATWCKPCLQEMPSIQRLIEKLKGEEIVFLFASDETAEHIEEFKNRNKYAFNYVQIENLSELNIAALPTTFIFNSRGDLVFSESGYRQWDSKNNIELINDLIKTK